MQEAENPDIEAVPNGHRTLHLTPLEVWRAQEQLETYEPEAFEADGFIHCTDDVVELMHVGNRFYQLDSREFVALTINCGRVSAPVIYEDRGRMFPHIYGPLHTQAIERVQSVRRNAEGRFLTVEE